METKQMTLGEMRVRVSFNTTQDADVAKLKRLSAELIDLCDALRGKGNPATEPDSEQGRLLSLAQTHYEDACMWAVKGATHFYQD